MRHLDAHYRDTPDIPSRSSDVWIKYMKITSHYSDITDWFFQTLQVLLQKKETVTIALPGGHSLDGWYASIIADLNV